MNIGNLYWAPFPALDYKRQAGKKSTMEEEGKYEPNICAGFKKSEISPEFFGPPFFPRFLRCVPFLLPDNVWCPCYASVAQPQIMAQSA